MHKFIFSLFFIIITSGDAFCQDIEVQNKSVTGVFQADGRTQSEIYSAINRWISINYGSAKEVIELNDESAGNIILKGVNTVEVKRPTKKGKYITPQKSHLIQTRLLIQNFSKHFYPCKTNKNFV